MLSEREFLYKLRSKENKSTQGTLRLVVELLHQEEMPIEESSFKYKIKNIVLKGDEKSSEQIVNDNFLEIIKTESPNKLLPLLVYLMSRQNFEETIRKNIFDIVLFLNYSDTPTSLQHFLEYFIKRSPENLEYVVANINQIFDIISPSQVFYVAQALKGLSRASDNIINKMLEDNKQSVAEAMLRRIKQVNINVDKDINDVDFRTTCKEYSELLLQIIEELLESENARMVDITKIGEGAFTQVYQIGQKVLKVGAPKKVPKIYNHRRLQQPEARFELIQHKYERLGCIEVSDLVDTLLFDVGEEELYEIYKELRDDGIVWTDVKLSNIGRLRADNRPTLGGKELYVEPETVGLVGKPAGEPLKAGDLVIIDADFLFTEDDPRSKNQVGFLVLKFANRYMKEKTARTKESIDDDLER